MAKKYGTCKFCEGGVEVDREFEEKGYCATCDDLVFLVKYWEASRLDVALRRMREEFEIKDKADPERFLNSLLLPI